MSELPTGWTEAPLGELLEGIEAGRSFKCSERPAEADEWGVIKVSAMTWYRFNQDENKAILDDRQIDPRFEINPGDLLFSRANTVAYVGAVVEVGETRPHLLLSDKSLRLIPRPEIAPRWLLYYLRSRRARQYLEALATGTSDSMRNISQATLRGLTVPLAPLHKQDQIVASIEDAFLRVDAGMASLERVRKGIKGLRSSALRRYLTYPDAPQVTIRDVATAIQYGYTAKATSQPIGPKMLRITDIQDGSVNWDAVPNCEIDTKNLPRFRLRSGDLVFARTGATVGKSFLIDEAPEAVFASYLIRLSFDGTVVPGYMALFFQSPEYWRQVADGSLGVGQPNVNATTLSRITMALPTIAEQKQAVLAMTELDHELTRPSLAVTAQLRRAQSMKSSILTAAFNGKLMAQEPSIEASSPLRTDKDFILRS